MFISHSPLERGRSFSTLLGLDEYSDFRQTLRTTTDTRVLNADLNLAALESQEAGFKTAATAAIVRVDTSFNAIIGDNAGDATKIDEYCDIILISLKQVPILAKIVTASVLNEVQFDAVIQAIKTEEGGKDRDRFVELSSSLGKLNAMGVADDEVVRSEIQELSDEINVLKTLFEATAGTTRKQLYSVANHLINGGSWHDPNKCPLCESELQKPIAEIVAEQQLQYQQTDAKISSIQTTWAGSQLQHRVAQLETLVGKDVPEAERKLNSTNEAISSGNISRTFAKP
jgi:uncharacterized protein with PIN domain